MLNGGTVQGKIAEGGVVEKLLDEKKTPEQIIEAIYIRCLTRKPTPRKPLPCCRSSGGGQSRAGLEDVFWAVLNSREFLFNH